ATAARRAPPPRRWPAGAAAAPATTSTTKSRSKGGRPPSATSPTLDPMRAVLLGIKGVDNKRLDQNETLGGDAPCEARFRDQRAEQRQVGVRRQQDIETPAGSKAPPRLGKQRGDIAITQAGMPSAIGNIPRLAGKRRRARDDYVENLVGRERREEIRAHGMDPVLQAVGSGILGCRQRCVRVDVDGGDL